MKEKYISVLSFLLFILILSSCGPGKTIKSESTGADHSELVYDSLLAEKYGADDYGMRKYVMAFLKRGPNRSLNAEEAAELQRAHMENIGRMAEEGKLALAGPFFGDGDLRGIYIFNVDSIEEAESLTNTDPAIKAGSLVMELVEWYGSAALMAVNELHGKLQKTSITD